MIGLYVRWQGAGFSPDIARRFASSFAAGTGAHMGQFVSGNAVMVQNCGSHILARSWRPLETQRGEWLLFDGYISNRKELRQELGTDLRSDAALYRAGYETWGGGIELRAIGSFSVIIFSTDQRYIRIARSPLDAPPLHVWRDSDRLIIATTPRAVFATGEIRPEVDEQKIADSLLLNYQEGDRGWYRGVARLKTGHRAKITPASFQIEQFYDLRNVPDVRLKSDQDYVEAAKDFLNEGTRAALDGFSRPAISISGGYDSQAVAAFALQNMSAGQRLLGLTAVPEKGWVGSVPPGRFADESGHVKAFAAQHPNVDVEWIDAVGLSFEHKLQAMFLLASVVPRNAINLHWIHEIWSRAKARNCDVVLTGSMGNASFSFDGEGMLPDLFRKGRWLKLANLLWQGRSRRSISRAMAGSIGMALAPEAVVRATRRFLYGPDSNPLMSWCPLNPEYAQDMDVFERAKTMNYDVFYRPYKSTKDIRDIMFGNPMNEAGDFLHGWEQIHGIPQRDPTSYRPLVEFCYAIPDDQYWRNGERRWLAKRMLKGIVPDIVISEKRRGLQNADWELRLKRESWHLKAELDRMEKDPVMTKRLDVAGLNTLMDRWLAGEKLSKGQQQRLQLAIPRALTTARFIRFVEGRNDG